MRIIAKLFALALGFVMLTGAAGTDTQKQTILIRSNDVTLHADADTSIGQYYTVAYTPPENLSREDLDRAILEVFVDVSAKVRGEYFNEIPVLEIYALTTPFSGSLNLEALHLPTGVVRPVVAEDGRRVILDITNIVRSHLAGTLENNGLIVGSLTGMREGEFTFVSGALAEGAVGQVRIYRRHQFAPVEVPSEGSLAIDRD